MASFKKTNTKILSKSSQELTPETIYWKNYSPPVLVKEFGPIDHIDFSPVEPYDFAITCSCRVQVYNPITKLVTKKLNKFKGVAYGGTFRKDGRLLCAGGEEATVKLFEVNSRSLLRLFSGHKAAVHRTFFTSDGTHIASFSDDKSTALWDIPSEKKVISYEEHSDYVRAGCASPVSPDIFISGGYDKIVKMYDTRTNKSVFTVSHDAPVESVLFLPSGGIFLSAGGNEIKVWDCLDRGKLLARISQHHKTITCLQIASNGQKILSGSLDKSVKIYDSGTYKTIHTLDYPNSILSLGISNNDRTLVVGMVDGIISLKQKEDVQETALSRKQISYKNSGKNLHSLKIDSFVPEVKKEITAKYDVCLRKFEYSKALDMVMFKYVVNKYPHITVSVFQQIIRRQGLTQALAGRDGKSLVNILKFIIRYIDDVKFGPTMLDVADVLMDIYENKIEELNLEVQVAFKNLATRLKIDVDFILQLMKKQASVETIHSAREAKTSNKIQETDNLLPSKTAQKDLILNIC